MKKITSTRTLSSPLFVIRNIWSKPLLRIVGDGRDFFKVMETDGVTKVNNVLKYLCVVAADSIQAKHND
jgi:hypothetical protein